MKIYDRYAGSAGDARRGQREDYLRLQRRMMVYILLAVLMLAVACIHGPGGNIMFFLFWGFVVLLLGIVQECAFPLRQNDLYTFGFDGRNFAVLGVSGKVKREVRPEGLEMIHILAVRYPATRTRRPVRGDGKRAVFTRFGERRRVNGKKQFVDEPMALLVEKDARGSGPEAFLCSGVGFVIGGGNTRIFLKLLQNSACPVMMNREFFELHKARLDALFAQAGMNLERLHIDGE